MFYIFYENEETSDKGVKSGLDLQRYIHEEVREASLFQNGCFYTFYTIMLRIFLKLMG